MSSDKKSEKPKEQEAVFTTIVGGRPPGSGTNVGNIPRGIEVLVKKASVDEEFRKLLLEKKAEAAKEIDLELDKNEADMLAAIPREQLEKIIDNIKVPADQKHVFMSSLGKVMLALVLAGATVGIFLPALQSVGISPDRMRELQMRNNASKDDPNDINDPNTEKLQQQTPMKQENTFPPVSRGISPDKIERVD
jgi:hypothetical protein